MLLDKYAKSSVIQQTNSEGTSFNQRGGTSNKKLPPYDKKYWKICNASDSYRKVAHHNIVKKQLPIQIGKNKLMTTNISRLKQVSPPILARQKV